MGKFVENISMSKMLINVLFALSSAHITQKTSNNGRKKVLETWDNWLFATCWWCLLKIFLWILTELFRFYKLFLNESNWAKKSDFRMACNIRTEFLPQTMPKNSTFVCLRTILSDDLTSYFTEMHTNFFFILTTNFLFAFYDFFSLSWSWE